MKQQAYQIERDRRVLVARPGCDQCTGGDIAQLTLDLRERIESGEADSVVIDLSKVAHMDSCCISRLLALRGHAVSAGGSVAFACCQPNVRFLLEMTRLDRMFGLYDRTEQAIAELRERRTRRQTQTGTSRTNTKPAPKHGYAPQLAALLRAHRRKNPDRQSAHSPDRP